MLVSLALFIIGFTMGGLNYVVTVLQARARGMTLMRMPLTIWGIFTATVMALLAFPALFVGAVMMLFDRLLGTSFFMPALVEMGQQLRYGGGSPILFQHLFWFFGHPEIYIVALPAFGIVSDLISTHARRNIFGYRMMVWAIVAIGALSFIVWAHHMYVSGMNPWFGFFFATDRKSTRLNSSHANISYAVFCLKKKTISTLYIFTTPFSSFSMRSHSRTPSSNATTRLPSVSFVTVSSILAPSILRDLTSTRLSS